MSVETQIPAVEIEELEQDLAASGEVVRWRDAVVYQVYPWTFHEASTAEPQRGIGNIAGITEKLDYLNELGVDAIWISPFYPSPMIDGGYDVSDYRGVHPDLGTLDDMDTLIAELHERGMKLMCDLVPNHTSDQHEWFQQSEQSRDNPYSDWYIWKDPAGRDGQGQPIVPNNWGSVFSKPQLERRRSGELQVPDGEDTPYLSGWTWSEARQQFYFHSFAVEQPDLNWQNPDVREAIYDVMRFWLDRGVDGFRVDAVNFIGKDPAFTDEDRNPAYVEGEWDNPYDQLQRVHSSGFPDTFYGYLQEMAAVLDAPAYRDRDTHMVLEAYMPDAAIDRINRVAPGKMSAFNFAGMKQPWLGTERGQQLRDYIAHLPSGAIPNYVNGNHDKARVASRLGEQAARSAALLNLMLPGMTTIYQGEEAGFVNAIVPKERQQDPLGGRDGSRTPILWNDSEGVGFSKAPEPVWWLPADRGQGASIAEQTEDPRSSLALYQASLREKHAVKQGSFEFIDTDDDIVGFRRQVGSQKRLVLANHSDQPRLVKLDKNLGHAAYRLLLSSISVCEDTRTFDLRSGIPLAPEEAIVVELIR